MRYRNVIRLGMNKSLFFLVVFSGLFLLLFLNCKKEAKGVIETTVPVLTTNAANITRTTADIEGKVTSNGGSAVTTQGICWGINMNPNIAGDKINIGAGSESFTIKLTGLTPGSTYYVRAYATNSAGTGYGNQKSFKTLIDVGEDIAGFGPFTTILANANIQPPASWNQNLPLSDQVNSSHWVLNPSFSDDFNTISLNTTNWTNTNLPFYQGNDPILLKPTTTGLEFYMRDDGPSAQRKYRGSWIVSNKLLLYGYIEGQVKVADNYANSNIFLFNKEAEKWTEIDIFEIYGLPRPAAGIKAASNVHVFYSPLISTHIEQQVAFVLEGGQTFADGYHVFGLAWTPTKISWYIDGRLVREGVNTSWHQPLWLCMGIHEPHTPPWMDQMPKDLVPIVHMSAKYIRVWTAQN
jgi:hypothetical protein